MIFLLLNLILFGMSNSLVNGDNNSMKLLGDLESRLLFILPPFLVEDNFMPVQIILHINSKKGSDLMLPA